MIPHYGKREPGLLTAASPGDTLYFPFASYNDSGDSEALTGLAVTDVEVIKNGSATVRATDSGYSLISDTGMVGDRAGLYRVSIQLFNTADDASFYASGSWYQAFIDAVTIDGRTVRFWLGSWEIGRQRVDVREIVGDTGAAAHLQQSADSKANLLVDIREINSSAGAASRLESTFANGFHDTGINERFGRIQSDVDTGLRVHIDDSDTGVKDAISDLDTGMRGILQTTGVNVTKIDGDTGAADVLQKFADSNGALNPAGEFDTGSVANSSYLPANLIRIAGNDTPATQLGQAFSATPTYFQQVDVVRLDGDTGAAAHLQQSADSKANLLVDVREVNSSAGSASFLATTYQNGFHDTGLNDRLGRIASDADTGLRAQISDVDTGLHDTIADVDTGLRGILQTTGVNIDRIDGDTGAANQLQQAFATTPTYFQQIDVQQMDGDTGAADVLQKFADSNGALNPAGEFDTGSVANSSYLPANLIRIAGNDTPATNLSANFASTPTYWQQVNVVQIVGDTGAAGWLKNTFVSGFSDTGLNDRLGDIQTKTDKLTFDTGNELRVDVRKVNNVTVQGDGQPGTEWRPGT